MALESNLTSSHLQPTQVEYIEYGGGTVAEQWRNSCGRATDIFATPTEVQSTLYGAIKAPTSLITTTYRYREQFLPISSYPSLPIDTSVSTLYLIKMSQPAESDHSIIPSFYHFIVSSFDDLIITSLHSTGKFMVPY